STHAGAARRTGTGCAPTWTCIARSWGGSRADTAFGSARRPSASLRGVDAAAAPGGAGHVPGTPRALDLEDAEEMEAGAGPDRVRDGPVVEAGEDPGRHDRGDLRRADDGERRLDAAELHPRRTGEVRAGQRHRLSFPAGGRREARDRRRPRLRDAERLRAD